MTQVQVGLGAGSKIVFNCSELNKLHEMSSGKSVDFVVAGGKLGGSCRKYTAKITRHESLISFHLQPSASAALEATFVVTEIQERLNSPTDLIKLCQKGRSEAFRCALREGCLTQTSSMTSDAFLDAVIKSKSLDMALAVFEAGLLPKDHTKCLLKVCTMSGWTFLAEKLIKLGAETNAKDSTGTPVLTLALRTKDQNLSSLLIKKGAKVDTKDSKGCSGLIEVLTSTKPDANLAILLIKNGANVNVKDSNGAPAFLLALKSEYKHLVTSMIDAGVEVNVAEKSGNTALMESIRLGDFEIFEQILEKTKDIDAVTNKNWSAVFLAAGFEQPMMLESLLNRGAKLLNNGSNNSPLINTVKYGLKICAQLLIQRAEKIGVLPELLSVKDSSGKDVFQLTREFSAKYKEEKNYEKYENYEKYIASLKETLVFSSSLQEQAMLEFEMIERPHTETKL